MDLGSAAVRLVLVSSLGMGYDHFAIFARSDFPGDTRAPRLARNARVALVWAAVGHYRTAEPLNAVVPTAGRYMGLVSPR